MKYLLKSLTLIFILLVSPITMAENYLIDTKSAHTSITFKVKHLGYSWLVGRFNTFAGHFSYDEKNLIEIKKIDEGDDPWGGYRIGFSGRTKFLLADFGIKKNLGPAAKEMILLLEAEGIRQ